MRHSPHFEPILIALIALLGIALMLTAASRLRGVRGLASEVWRLAE